MSQIYDQLFKQYMTHKASTQRFERAVENKRPLGKCRTCKRPVKPDQEYVLEARSPKDIRYTHFGCYDEAE